MNIECFVVESAEFVENYDAKKLCSLSLSSGKEFFFMWDFFFIFVS